MMRSFLAILLVFIFYACNNNKAEKTVVTTPPPKYYFYPRANVYYDSANKDFVYLSNDGKTWQAEKQIPAAMQVLLDKNILIDTPAQPVWKDNERHKLIYSALLYASPADTQAVKEEKPLVKEVPKEVKKEKKGLGKFLDKIFGRKKKDADN
jgi:hypothetical protein